MCVFVSVCVSPFSLSVCVCVVCVSLCNREKEIDVHKAVSDTRRRRSALLIIRRRKSCVCGEVERDESEKERADNTQRVRSTVPYRIASFCFVVSAFLSLFPSLTHTHTQVSLSVSLPLSHSLACLSFIPPPVLFKHTHP